MDNDKILNVEIITPQKTIYSGKAISVAVPGSQSPFQVLYNHAPIVTSLDTGIIKIIDEDKNEKYFASKNGFAEVRKNLVSILVDNAEDGAKVDLSIAKNLLDIERKKLKESDNKNEIENLKNNVKYAEFLIKASERS